MKLMTLAKTAAFAIATMAFVSCTAVSSEDSNTEDGTSKDSLAATGVIEFSILGEDIPYQELEFTGNLKSAKIDYAYMLVKNPTLNSAASDVVLEGTWAVDLMSDDRTPVVLGYADADTGAYEVHPEITIPATSELATATDKGGLSSLTQRDAGFVFGGSFVDADGVTHTFEVREPLPELTVAIEEFPTTANGEAGTHLYVAADDTLRAEFHPHIDHALEVLDENPIDFSQLTKEGDLIVISDAVNSTAKTTLGSDIAVYDGMVGHINRGDHWDVNVIPEEEVVEPESGTGVIEFSILGEDIPYQELEFTGNLQSAKIDYAYMMVKNPTLMPSHEETRAARHAGMTLESIWAVDLMSDDRTPVVLGYVEADTGGYEDHPKISIPAVSALADAVDKGGLDSLSDRQAGFVFGGSFVDVDGVTHMFEVREPLPTITIDIEEYPTAANGEAGTKLYLASGDTLRAEFHPHIDHALEVLDENPIDFTALEKVGELVVISDEMNMTAATTLGGEVNLWLDMVAHINRGDHWDVNVIP